MAVDLDQSGNQAQINNSNVRDGPFFLETEDVRATNTVSAILINENRDDADALLILDGRVISGVDGVEITSSDGGEGITLGTTGGIFAAEDGISTVAGNNTLTLAGMISADGDGVALGGDGLNRVMLSGIISSALDGIEAAGNQNKVTVSGAIVSGGQNGMVFNGNANTVVVSGSVEGTLDGIRLVGDGQNVKIDGLVGGLDNGVALTGDGAKITVGTTGVVRGGDNGGLTSAVTFQAGDVADGVGGASTLVNHGSLISDTVSEITNTAVAVWDFSGQAQVFTNTGDVQGDVLLQGGNDTMTNAGTIVGNISLGTGNDVFTSIGSGVVTGKIDGGAGFDTFRGGDLSDSFFGGDQADNMRGGAGIDSLFGEAGNDLIIGDTDGANDLYDGGTGIDTVSYAEAVSAVRANLTLQFALGSEIGVDRLVGVESLTGGSGDDSLTGSTAAGTFSGGAGNDILSAGSGNDVLLGGDGADTINGGAGFDTITGGTGNDRLTGAFNADTFIFANGFGKDIITDFDSSNSAEKIDLSAVANITDFNDLALNHLTQVGANAVISDGVDTITLLGVQATSLDSNDFIF